MTEWTGITKMRINNFGYLLKEGIRGIFLHGFMSFAAVCVTVACLVIVGSFSVLMYNVNIMVEELNKTNEIVVYIDASYEKAEARSISTDIAKIPNVQNSRFMTREEALEAFVDKHQGNSAFSGVQAEDLRHRHIVTLMDNNQMEQTVSSIRQIKGVADVRADYQLAEGFATLQSMLRIASFAVIIVLLVVSLLIISNTVKIAVYDRKDEIAIMKMVGATNGFIRLPFIVEGLILGMLGAGVAFGLEWLLYDALVAKLAAVDTLQLFSFVPFQQLLWPMVATFGTAGFFVGVMGSWNSIRKFMDV